MENDEKKQVNTLINKNIYGRDNAYLYTNVVAKNAKKTYDSTIGRIVKLSRAHAHARIYTRARFKRYERILL